MHRLDSIFADKTNTAFLIFVLLSTIILAAIFPQDWAGWILTFFIFLLINLFEEFQVNKRLLIAGYVIIISHLVISILNAYFGTFLWASPDAITFHKIALSPHIDPGFNFTVKNYSRLLAILYKINVSRFFGQQASLFNFTLATIIFVKLQSMLEQQKFATVSLLTFWLLPAYLFWTSVELREAWGLLFFMFALFCFIGFNFKLFTSIRSLLFALIAIIFGCLLHVAMFFFYPVLVVITASWLFFTCDERGKIFSFKSVLQFVVLLLFSLFFVLLVYLFTKSHLHLFTAGKNLFFVIFAHQKVLLKFPGTFNYYISWNPSSIASCLGYLIKSWTYYLFGPFPWNFYHHFSGLFLMLLGWFRAMLLLFACVCFLKCPFFKKGVCIYLFFVFIALTLKWAIGTVNFGTAFRHNMLTDWILILIGLPKMLDFFKIKLRKIRSFSLL